MSSPSSGSCSSSASSSSSSSCDDDDEYDGGGGEDDEDEDDAEDDEESAAAAEEEEDEGDVEDERFTFTLTPLTPPPLNLPKNNAGKNIKRINKTGSNWGKNIVIRPEENNEVKKEMKNEMIETKNDNGMRNHQR